MINFWSCNLRTIILKPSTLYFIKFPELSTGGDKIDYPVSGTDFYPTFLELAGAELLPLEHNDGISLVPLFNNKTLAERALIWHFPHYGNQGGEPSSMIRRGDWKLIHYYENNRNELYNLANDIGKTTDLSAQYPQKVVQLSQEFFYYSSEVGAKYPEPDPEYSETAEQNLFIQT